MRLLLFTCRFKLEGFDNFNRIASEKRCILMVWHNRLALVPEILTRFAPKHQYTAVISNSRDAEVLAILASSYGGKTIRVPHNGRHQALRKMTQELQSGKEVIIITPDGPRGPPYQVKSGIVVAAKHSAAYIVPLSWTATRFWQLNTWDKMLIPKPFSTIRVTIGDGIQLNEELESESEATTLLQKALTNLPQ